MQVLLDTNVLAAGIVGAHLEWQTPPTRIRNAWMSSQFEVLISAHLLDELQRTLERPWFVTRIDETARDHSLEQVRRNALMVEITTVVTGITSHAADDLVLSAAVSGQADYLVTGDADFLRVRRYQSVRIRTPAQFLSVLESISTAD